MLEGVGGGEAARVSIYKVAASPNPRLNLNPNPNPDLSLNPIPEREPQPQPQPEPEYEPEPEPEPELEPEPQVVATCTFGLLGFLFHGRAWPQLRPVAMEDGTLLGARPPPPASY